MGTMVKMLAIVWLMLTGSGQVMAQSKDPGYRIEVTIEGIQDSVAYLGYHYGDQKYVRDTAEVKNATVVFSGKSEIPTGVYFVYTPKIFLEIIVKDQIFSIRTDTVDLVGNFKVKGSEENKIFGLFKSYMSQSQRKYQEFNSRLEMAVNATDSGEITQEIQELSKEIKEFKTGLINEHSNTFVAALLRMNEKNEVPEEITDPSQRFFYYREHYFDRIDLGSTASLRTPLFHNVVMEYFDQLTIQNPDSIIVAVDRVLDLASDPDVFRYLLVKLSNKYETSKVMGMENVFVYLAEEYYLKGRAEWADDELLEKIATRVAELKPNLIGKEAPPMFLLDTALSRASLYEMDHEFLVLYFYDPSCGHCKKKTPILRDSYRELRSLGTEVIAVCTTTDINDWKNYIKENQLAWTNLADPYVRSNFRKDYNIASTPTVYVLDRDKQIIAKGLGVEQIPDFIRHQVERKETSEENN